MQLFILLCALIGCSSVIGGLLYPIFKKANIRRQAKYALYYARKIQVKRVNLGIFEIRK